MTTSHKLMLALLALLTTMACAYVENMIFPPSPAPDLPASGLPSLTAEPAPAEVPTQWAEPFDNPEPITCSDDDCLDACLDRLDTVLETKPFKSIGNSIYEEQGANLNLVVYQVKGDEITDPAVLYVPDEYRKYQEDTDSHLRIWKFYAAMIPAELRALISEFIIYTDGPEGESMAWVQPSSTHEGTWQVGFDLLDSDYPLYLAETLVHETAHVMTLNEAQVPYDEDHFYFYNEKEKGFPGCDQYVLDGSCSLPESYINLFYQQFWKDSYAEWWELDQEAQNAATSDEYFEIMEEFYNDHSDWFLNDYAATDIREDMAESFAFFALNPRPSGDEVYEQKVAFFYDFPELVEYRQQMIEGLCSYIR